MSISSHRDETVKMGEFPAELERPFQILAFDWDTTVHANRPAADAALRDALERLLAEGIALVVQTRDDLSALERRFAASGAHKQRLFVLSRGGNEIYGFDCDSQPVLLWHQTATAEENRRCLESAWRKGLPKVRIAGEVDRSCVDLGEASIALNAMLCELAEHHDVPHEQILLVADGLLSPTGLERTERPAAAPLDQRAVVVSLSPDAVELPDRVIRLGGGLAAFQALLEQQAVLHERRRQQAEAWQSEAKRLPARWTDDRRWLLVEEGFNLAREHEIESLFTTANGYVGVRGSLAEGSSLSTPRTFVAGVFGIRAEPGAIPELVTAPDWTHLKVFVDGQPLTMESDGTLEHRRILDMRQGILWRLWRYRDAAGRITRLSYLRLASLADRHVMAQSITITPENYSGRIRLERQLPDAVAGMPLARAAEPSQRQGTISRAMLTQFTAPGKGIAVAMAGASQFHSEGSPATEHEIHTGPEAPLKRREVEAELGKTYRIDRIVSIYTTRDVPDPAEAAINRVESLFDGGGIEAVIDAHRAAWAARWRTAEVDVEGDPDAQRALRFAIYHLISTANPEDERVSIGARALTGDSYKGHVFWDTEIYMLPFYIYTHPATARALLMYRYHTLGGAREKARSLGYQGAMYAWESADDGLETTPATALSPDGRLIRILCGELEQHITADVAYGVWHYWQATGDDAFFRDAGAEILLDTARFWASRVQRDEDGLYHIRHVIGPDEYHEGVDDNAFTNIMAQWNLEQGAAAARLLEERWPDRARELFTALKLTPDQFHTWLSIAGKMDTGFDPESGLFEQFDGFFNLETINLADFEPRIAPIDVLLGRERTQRAQVVKQADVVMLMALLWDRFSQDVRAANFHFYEPRTGHGSSLSPGGHAMVAARLGEMAVAARYFHQAAMIDLANNMGNASGGVHAAALGGLWQAAVMGFGGMSLRPDGLAFAPQLPPKWMQLRFPVQWRGRQLMVTMRCEPRSVEIEQQSGPEGMVVSVADGPPVTLRPGRRYLLPWQSTRWGTWEELA
jgi:trehalose/maltose hydrolase-like predicted phosphorylase